MGLFEKLKNTFFEEEYVEVDEPTKEIKVAKKVEDTKKEKKIEPIEEIKEEDKLKELIEEQIDERVKPVPKQEFYSDREIINKGNKLVSYDDDDFEPTKQIPVVINEKKEEKRIYGEIAPDMHINLDDMDKYKYPSHRAYGSTEENKFEPTPIISPIYGILDKNYRKEEVIDKRDKPSSYVSRKNVDLDSKTILVNVIKGM